MTYLFQSVYWSHLQPFQLPIHRLKDDSAYYQVTENISDPVVKAILYHVSLPIVTRLRNLLEQSQP
jgi:hypothetical protein